MNIYSKIFLVLIGVLFINGCSVMESLRNADQKMGDMYEDFQDSSEENANDFIKDTKENIGEVVELSEEQKGKVDKWLEGNDFNKFGDALGTMYAGGTPLFNEATGEIKDRFEYIMEKIPDILEKIKEIELEEFAE